MIKQLVINNKKSFDDFNVYIASRNISSPKKKIIKESIPFSNVVYDFSNINGEIYWEERTLQYTFDIAEISTEEMENVKSKLLDWFLNVHDTDIYDPYIGDYHFHGSYNDGSWSEDFGAGTISVSFSVYPYKISNSDINVIEEIGVSDGLIEGNYSITGLKIDGKSIQDGEPTPESPVEIESVGDDNVEIISSNANLLSSKTQTLTTNGVTISYDEDTQTLTLNGTCTTDNTSFGLYTNINGASPLLVRKGESLYGEIVHVSGSSTGYFNFRAYDKNWNYGLQVSSTSGVTENIKKQYKAQSDVEFTLVGIRLNADSVCDNLKIKLMLSKVDCDYVKREASSTTIALNEPLRSLPNGICDTYKNGVITRRVGRVVLNGSENWSRVGTDAGYRYYFTKEGVKPNTKNNIIANILCNIFTAISPDSSWFSVMGITILTNSPIIAICYENEEVDSLDKFKAWLSENNVEVLYELATPTTETIEQPTITSYTPITHISLSEETTFEVYYNEVKNITMNNNSSHRIAPMIKSTGSFTITLNNTIYSIGEGTYNGAFYLEPGTNELKITGYGEITFSYSEEVF